MESETIQMIIVITVITILMIIGTIIFYVTGKIY